MRIRQLLTASGLYGIADMLVIGVSGFLLLPLYTRALPQSDFGAYVIVKANTEILGYIIYFGLLSAVGRLYFDYRNAGEARDYFNSVLMFFLAAAAFAALVLSFVGEEVWWMLSPSTPSEPYLWYTLGLAVASFVSQLGSLWLRLDNRVSGFVSLQIVSAGLVAAAAWVNLIVLKLGLPGLLLALAIGYLPAAVLLFARIGDRLRPIVHRAMIGPSLHYGIPFAVGYIAYFILNRFSVLTLQHHVALDQIAIFGLAQQIALMISIVSQSFGKAMQPAVFAADPEHAPEILRRSGKLFILLIFGAAAAAIVFANELIRIVAPRSYLSGFHVMLVLLVASFVYSLSLVSDTVLQYHRRPRIQASVSVLGAIMSVVLGLLLIPRFGLLGGAVATLGAYLTMTISGHIVAYRISGQSYFGEMGLVTAALCGLAVMAAWPGWTTMFLPLALVAKAAIAAAVFVALFALYAPQRLRALVARARALRKGG